MSIAEALRYYNQQLASWPQQPRLVAVSKTKPVSDLREAYAAGQRIFGENHVQEMVAKAAEMPADVQWHQIGHLQTNKVKYIAPFVSLIHSVDSERLLVEIDKQAARHNRVIDCLLQVHIAQEETKFGLSAEEVTALLQPGGIVARLLHIRIVGFMGIASLTDDEAQINSEFAGLAALRQSLLPLQNPHVQLHELSMGMSNDYAPALTHGATLVRIGSAIFGNRQYK